jgi:hypothetical protein
MLNVLPNLVLARYWGNVRGVNIMAPLSEDVAVTGQEGGSAVSDNVVTKTVLSILFALIKRYALL